MKLSTENWLWDHKTPSYQLEVKRLMILTARIQCGVAAGWSGGVCGHPGAGHRAEPVHESTESARPDTTAAAPWRRC